MVEKEELLRIAKFTGFSLSAGIIEMAVFTLLNENTGWSHWPCYLTALVCSVLWNFTFNRKFTFKSASNVPVAMLKVAAFYAVFTPLTTLLEKVLADDLGMNEYLITALNMALNFGTEYLYDKYVVFRDTLKKD